MFEISQNIICLVSKLPSDEATAMVSTDLLAFRTLPKTIKTISFRRNVKTKDDHKVRGSRERGRARDRAKVLKKKVNKLQSQKTKDLEEAAPKAEGDRKRMADG